MFLKHIRSFSVMSSYFHLVGEMTFATSFHPYFSNLKAKFTSARRTSLSCFSEAASPRYSIESLCMFPLLHSNYDCLTHYFFFFVDCLLHKNISIMKTEAWTNLLTLNSQSLASCSCLIRA